MPERQSRKKYDSAKVQGNDSWVLVERMTVADLREAQDTPAEQDMEYTLGLFERKVIDWNWVDSDGALMPNPQEDPGVLDTLTDQEFGFLVDCIKGNEEELKN